MAISNALRHGEVGEGVENDRGSTLNLAFGYTMLSISMGFSEP